jgi:hypothetical protein
METTEEKRATFTPGPWVVGSSVTAGNKLEGCSIFAEKIKDQIGWMRFDLDEENHANARLIAAAPEMYEVLSELLDTLEMSKGYGFDEEYEKAREVLAKVEGGEG